MQLRSLLGTVAALAITVGAGLGLASPALAAGYGPKSGSCHVSATNVRAGHTVIVTGDGFKARSIVTMTVTNHGRVYTVKTTRSSGSSGTGFSRAALAPGHVRFTAKLTRTGTNSIRLIGTQADGTGTLTLNASVNVRGAGAASSSGLPGTGGVNFTPLWAGLGLLAAGALLVSVAHSRRRILV